MRLTVLPVLAAALALSGCVVAVPTQAPDVVAPPVVVRPPVTITPARPDTAAARQVANAEMSRRLPGRNVRLHAERTGQPQRLQLHQQARAGEIRGG